MCKILVDQGFKCGIDTVIVGPCNDREGAVKLGNNQSITQEEADAFEKIAQAGYKIKFAYYLMFLLEHGMILKVNLVIKIKGDNYYGN